MVGWYWNERAAIVRRSDQLFKTMSAVRQCVESCRRSNVPWAIMEEYVRALRLNPDWNDQEIAEVEAIARRALAACDLAPSDCRPHR
jgi:hypothetical protein